MQRDERADDGDTTDPLTPAVFHVLLALADGPRHGYAIMQATHESAGTSRRLGPGTIYGTLERLEEKGFVRELDGESHSAGRRRRSFELLPAGEQALRREVSRLERLAALARAKRLLSEGSS